MNNRPVVASTESKARINAMQELIIKALKRSAETDSLVTINALLHLAVVAAVVDAVPLETLLEVATHHYQISSDELKASMT